MRRRFGWVGMIATGVLMAACFDDQIETPEESPVFVQPTGSAEDPLADVSAFGPTAGVGSIGMPSGPRLPEALPEGWYPGRSKPPSVRMGEMKVSSGLPPEVVLRTLRRSCVAGFRRCYDEALKKDPQLTGSATIQFTIQKNGGSKHAKVSNRNGLPKEVVECLQEALGQPTFPAPEGGRSATVTSIVVLVQP